MNKSGIYKIQSILNPQRFYIGSCVNFSNRKATHFNRLKCGKHHSKKLQRHYDKYGADDLEITLIHICNKEDLLFYEQIYLNKNFPYFNTCKIAGSTLGVVLTEEHKKKISISGKGNQNCLGNKLSEEHKLKLSVLNKGSNNRFYGKKHSEKTRKIISEKNIGKKGRLVININTGIFYETIKQAAFSINMNSITLNSRLNGYMKNTTPFRFA